MRAPGKYVRTPKIRLKNRANAQPGRACPDMCTCRRHVPNQNPAGSCCVTGCGCGKHQRTPEHNARIGLSVSLTAEAKYGRN